MCELLAMSCRHPARLTSSLTALAGRAGSTRNRDGWGLAIYQGRDIALHRDITPAHTSPLVPWLEANGPSTTLAVGYIRHATQGAINLANTGPFSRELNGRMHVFAHNGNLKNLAQTSPIASRFYRPVGDTDSELAFCLLLDQIRQQTHVPTEPLPLQTSLNTVINFARTLRALGPASFLYADGDVLYAHADRRLQLSTPQVTAPALYRLECPAGGAALVRDCESENTQTAQRVILLASVPLTDESWVPMAEGEILAIHLGAVVASVQL
jgi:predicted glutamine amidotransferase